MKQIIKISLTKKIVVIVLLLLTGIMFGTNYAYAKSKEYKTIHYNLLSSEKISHFSHRTELKDQVMLTSEDKSFVYELGGLDLKQDTIYAKSHSIEIQITKYDWYVVTYDDGRSIIAADIITGVENPEIERITGAFIYAKNSGKYLGEEGNIFGVSFEEYDVLEVFYISEDFNTLHKVFILLDEGVFSIISELSQELILNEENLVSEIIQASLSWERTFKSSMQKEKQVTSVTD